MDKEELISKYFKMGLTYREINDVLYIKHGHSISMRHLKRILQRHGMNRRKNYSPIVDVVQFLCEQLQTSGQLHGYRWMHQKCVQAGLKVQKENVRILLQTLDPNSVYLRSKRKLKRRQYSSKGPNFIWHLDSYDKLKPYGICINGCIDGFSRRIIWMKANRTSSNPRVIAGYFIEAVIDNCGLPMVIRGDMGTENVYVADMQMFLRRNGDDTYAVNGRSFIYGTSQHNQRIESWWGILRKENIQFWKSLFEDIKLDGLFGGTFIDKSLMQFCFLPLIKKELAQLVDIWNSHKIRKSKVTNQIYGRPTVLYDLPELYGTRDYTYEFDIDEILSCMNECEVTEEIPCDQDVYTLAVIYMEENDLLFPSDAFEAATLYRLLKNYFDIDV